MSVKPCVWLCAALLTSSACGDSKKSSNAKGSGTSCQTTDTCPVVVGESCAEKPCVSTAYCSGETSICVAKGGFNAACTAANQCLAPLTCDIDAHTCTGDGGLGSSCASASGCSDGLGCDLSTHTCATTTDGTSLYQAMCQHFESCANTDGHLTSSASACVSAMVSSITDGTSCNSTVRFFNTRTELDACAATLAGAPCAGFDFMQALPAPCLVLRVDTDEPAAGVGEDCEAADCRSDLYCDVSGSCPICQERPGAGGDCSGSADCAIGTYCEPTTELCTAAKTVNAACSGDDECASSYCHESLGTCQQPVAKGQACGVADRCAGFLLCDGGICASRRMPGESCTAWTPGISNCVADAACVSGHCTQVAVCGQTIPVGEPCTFTGGCTATAFCDDSTGTCTPRPGVGDDCNYSTPCTAELVCLAASRTCGAPSGVGEACSVSSDCEASLACDWQANLCVAPVADGSPCTLNAQCMSSHCDLSVTPHLCTAALACSAP